MLSMLPNIAYLLRDRTETGNETEFGHGKSMNIEEHLGIYTLFSISLATFVMARMANETIPFSKLEFFIGSVLMLLVYVYPVFIIKDQ